MEMRKRMLSTASAGNVDGSGPAQAAVILVDCTGTCGYYELHDDQTTERGANCLYQSANPGKLDQITVRPPLMHGNYPGKTKVEWRFRIRHKWRCRPLREDLLELVAGRAGKNDSIPASWVTASLAERGMRRATRPVSTRSWSICGGGTRDRSRASSAPSTSGTRPSGTARRASTTTIASALTSALVEITRGPARERRSVGGRRAHRLGHPPRARAELHALRPAGARRPGWWRDRPDRSGPLPGRRQLAIQGRRPHRRIFGQAQGRRAQDERLGLPAAEAAVRADELLESGDLPGDAVDSAQQDEVTGVREAIEVNRRFSAARGP